MVRYLAVVAVLLGLTAVSCDSTEDLGGEGAPPPMPSTPFPAATALPAATPDPTAATPARPAAKFVAVPTLEPGPTPPAVPWVSIEYGGSVHYGRQGSYCWPVSANSSVCVDKIGWEDFDSAPALEVKRGDELSVVVLTDETSPGEVQVQVYTVQSTEPLRPGEEVYSAPAGEGTTLDIEPGTYFLSAFYKSRLGDVSYGFKLEVVE